jgi:hypothetical protein
LRNRSALFLNPLVGLCRPNFGTRNGRFQQILTRQAQQSLRALASFPIR